MKKVYKENKGKKVGEKCICPSCKTLFIKTNYQQAFCKSKGKTLCKDKYWNNVDPKKRNNTTRISPASSRYTRKIEKEYALEDYYDLGWDSHKDTF